MKKYIYGISMIALTVLISCESQKLDILNYGKIEGKVLDGETYLPIPGVMITTTPASVVLISDSNGEFTIQKVLEGNVVVNLKKKEYLSNALTVAIYGDESTQMDFLIFKDDVDLGDVSIYDPVPGNGAVDQSVHPKLSWKVDVESTDAALTYNVYIFESNSTVQKSLGEDVVLKEVTASDLKANTTYFWYVVAKYDGNKIAFSPTWSFKTVEVVVEK